MKILTFIIFLISITQFAHAVEYSKVEKLTNMQTVISNWKSIKKIALKYNSTTGFGDLKAFKTAFTLNNKELKMSNNEKSIIAREIWLKLIPGDVYADEVIASYKHRSSIMRGKLKNNFLDMIRLAVKSSSDDDSYIVLGNKGIQKIHEIITQIINKRIYEVKVNDSNGYSKGFVVLDLKNNEALVISGGFRI